MPTEGLFLAHFTFRSGEAEVPFHHTLFADTTEEAMLTVRTYLREFARDPRPTGPYSYEYEKGAYAVLFEGLGSETSISVVKHLQITGTKP